MKRFIILYLCMFSFVFSEKENDFKKWEIKYNYTTAENINIDEAIPYVSVFYKKEKKYTLIYNKEWVYRDNKHFRNGEYVELYKGNFYYIVGRNDFMNLNAGVEYTHKLMTYGIKINSYDEQNVMFYKLQRDHYFKNSSVASAKVTFIDAEELKINYMAKLKYKIWSYSHYFDFKQLNKGIGEIKINKKEKSYDINLGFAYDFYTMNSGVLLGFGVKF